MLAHNLSEHDVSSHSNSPKTFEGGVSTVRIVATRGCMQVVCDSWVSLGANAICTLFDVRQFYRTDEDREQIDYVFCGISQNTRMAANAFEVMHNLVCDWHRSREGSTTSYCIEAAESFRKSARDTKDQETLEMIRLDQEEFTTQVVKELQDENE